MGSITAGLLIPAGEFKMGSNTRYGEAPIHTVYPDAFYIDKYEVTNAQFKQFVADNPEWSKDGISRRYHDGDYLRGWVGDNDPNKEDNHPVIWVSWYAAMAYAQWAGKRLPTEAEWEKAARGGLEGRTYPWGDSIDRTKANYNQNVGTTTPVDQYSPNRYGLYDMVGNVREWRLDEYDKDFYQNSPGRNPIAGDGISGVTVSFTNVNKDTARVLRGGSWNLSSKYLRVANRGSLNPSHTYSRLGFRCARSVAP